MLVSKTIIRTYTSHVPHIYNAPHVQRALALVEFVYVLKFILSLLVLLEALCRPTRRTIHTTNKNILSNLFRWQFPFYLCELVFFWADRMNFLTTIPSNYLIMIVLILKLS